MTESDDDPGARTPIHGLTRRQLLKAIGGTTAAIGAGRVGYEYTGFGHISGTNLLEQSLAPLARRRLEPTPMTVQLPGGMLQYDGDRIEFHSVDGELLTSVSDDGTDPDDTAGLEDPVVHLLSDLHAIRSGDVSYEFLPYRQFFNRLEAVELRPLTVATLRGERFRKPSTETIRRFSGVDPYVTTRLLSGLAAGFRSRTFFDVPRYVAGVVETYLVFESVPLQSRFEEPTTIEAIMKRPSGLYCAEYALRSVEAFHAVPPHRQTVPVFGGIVVDDRHNHAYTALGSVVRESDSLRVPMTFLDYFYSTLFDTLGVARVTGDGFGAYDEFHRATSIHYDNIYGYDHGAPESQA